MEELLFNCPQCGSTITPPEEGWSTTCPRCLRTVDLTGQFAYVRAFQAYEEAAEVMDELKDAKKLKANAGNRHAFEEREHQAFTLFSEAYSSLQEAFRYELAEKQHEHSVKMMINIAQLFTPRHMISGIEAAYWNTLMVEQTARKEYLAINARLEGENGEGHRPMPFFARWRATLRRDQLQRELIRLDEQIRGIEKGLKFAYNFHPYRGRK